jgi:hypothetical protein
MLLGKLRVLGIAAVASLAVACVVENDHPRVIRVEPAQGEGSSASSTGGSTSGGPATGTSTPSASPVLVDVDTDKTMNAAPGEGVGVFVEYASGGHWHVWWTCDTNVNPQGALTCDFKIGISSSQGTLAVTRADAVDPVVALTPKNQQIDATTVTGSTVSSLWFDGDPGGTITIQATIGDQLDGRYFFFVQNGQVNGGYNGVLTDPLMFQGTKP